MKIVIQHLGKSEIFTMLFQYMKFFTEHVNIHFEKERMYIQSMDSSRISIFEVSLPKEWFDVYELTNKDASTTIGINSSIFFKVLNSRDKNQEIKLDYEPEDGGDKLNIHFVGNNKTEFDKHFEISLMDIDFELLSIPNEEYQAEFSISSFNFANMINQLKMFGDNLDVSCSEENIMLCSNSIEQGKMFVEIKIDDLSSFMIDEGQNIKMSFSLNSLHNICLYNKLSKEVNIFIKDSYPMKIIYNIFGHEDAKMTFFLAPKISVDDD